VEFVGKGDFGLASGQRSDGTYDRIWYSEPLAPDEVAFESGVFMLTKDKAKALTAPPVPIPGPLPAPGPQPALKPAPVPGPGPGPAPAPGPGPQIKKLRVYGEIPPELWNRLGTKIIPKLKSASDFKIGVEFAVAVDEKFAKNMETELRQILEELGLGGKVKMEEMPL
jgi:hypothetical protein